MGDNRTPRTPPPPTDGWDPPKICLFWAITFTGAGASWLIPVVSFTHWAVS